MLTLTSCSGAVRLDPPDPAVNPDACDDFMAHLPATVAGQASRDTDPASDLTAAWGDPAITVRCGVPDPSALAPDAQLFRINGVSWFPEPLSAGYVFTTYQRKTNVEVTVPDDYAPESGAVTELSDLVKNTIAPDPKA